MQEAQFVYAQVEHLGVNIAKKRIDLRPNFITYKN